MEKEQDCEASLLTGWTDRDLSLWEVRSNEQKPQLNDILVALCRYKKNYWEKMIYILFPEETVLSTGLKLTPSNGNTGVNFVDISGTHFEIKGITGKELCTLIFHISKSKFEIKIFKKKELESLLYDIFDNTKKYQVVNGDTSQTPSVNISSSGSGVLITTEELEEISNGQPSTEQIPSSSSTT
jgi:hypothetical protein